jgi:hypothetical protein
MNKLETIITELFKFEVIADTGLKQEDAYVSILRSIIKKKGPPDSYQQAHRDYPTETVDALKPGDKEPLTCLIAFEDFTKFCYFRKSHVKGMGELDNGKKPTELILMQGEFVVFHSKLVHFGGAYTQSNLRMHVYLLSPKCGLGTVQDEDGPLTEPYISGRKRKSNSLTTKALIAKAVKAKAVKKQKREQQGKRLLLGKRLRGQQPIEVIV